MRVASCVSVSSSLTRSQVYWELAVLEHEGLVDPAGARDARPASPMRVAPPTWKWLTEWPKRSRCSSPLPWEGAGPSALRDVLRSRTEHRARRHRELDEELATTDDGEPWARATLAFGIRYEEAMGWFSSFPLRSAPLTHQGGRTGLRRPEDAYRSPLPNRCVDGVARCWRAGMCRRETHRGDVPGDAHLTSLGSGEASACTWRARTSTPRPARWCSKPWRPDSGCTPQTFLASRG